MLATTQRGGARAQVVVVATGPAIVVVGVVARLGQQQRHVAAQAGEVALEIAVQLVHASGDVEEAGFEVVVDDARGERRVGDFDLVGNHEETKRLRIRFAVLHRHGELEAAIGIAAERGRDVDAEAVGLDLADADAVAGDLEMAGAAATVVAADATQHPAAQRAARVVIHVAADGDARIAAELVRFEEVGDAAFPDMGHQRAVGQPEADAVADPVEERVRDVIFEADAAIDMLKDVAHILAPVVGGDALDFLAIDDDDELHRRPGCRDIHYPAACVPVLEAVEIAAEHGLACKHRHGRGFGHRLRSPLAQGIRPWIRACTPCSLHPWRRTWPCVGERCSITPTSRSSYNPDAAILKARGARRGALMSDPWADGVGFEPTVRLAPRRFSRPLP